MKIQSTVPRFWPAKDGVPQIVIPIGMTDFPDDEEHTPHNECAKKLTETDLARRIGGGSGKPPKPTTLPTLPEIDNTLPSEEPSAASRGDFS